MLVVRSKYDELAKFYVVNVGYDKKVMLSPIDFYTAYKYGELFPIDIEEVFENYKDVQ